MISRAATGSSVNSTSSFSSSVVSVSSSCSLLNINIRNNNNNNNNNNAISRVTSNHHRPCPRLYHRRVAALPTTNMMLENHSDDDDDDIQSFLQMLPCDMRENLLNKSKQEQLLEVVLDLGRFPEVYYLGQSGGHCLRGSEVSMRDLEHVQEALGEFGEDNRAGIEGTLHRISAMRSRSGVLVGLTCRVGRAIRGCIDMVHDLLQYGESILFVGRPGVGKTTVMREISRVLSDKLQKRVVIVDTSSEIGGAGNVPHSSIGSARRIQVPEPSMQHRIMIEAVENHMPQVIIVDEIGTEAEVHACRSIAERGVMLVGTAHGERLENIIKNPTLSDLIGGVKSVTLGDQEARTRGCNKSILERKSHPTFPFLIEMRERNHWVAHRTERSVDFLLKGKKPLVECRQHSDHCSR